MALVVLGVVAIIGVATAPQDHALADIGTTSAVNPASFGTPPGQVTRVLVPALDVFADERIETDAGGVTQILFRDGSHMTIGPNSDLVIDRFIFDPDTSTGEMAISLGRGVLRFVGGQLSKDGTVTLATPVAVIGVRGGIAVVEHDPIAGTNAVFLFGAAMTVQGIGETAESVRVSRPGFSVSVGADGAPGPVVPVEPEDLDTVLAAVEGDTDSSGDVQDLDVESSDSLGQTVSVDPVRVEDTASLSSALAEQDHRNLESLDQSSPAALLVYDLDGIRGFRGDVFRRADAVIAVYPLTFVKPEGPFGNAWETGSSRFLYTANSFAGTGAGQVGEIRVYMGQGSNLADPASDYRLFGILGGSSRDTRRNTWIISGPIQEYDARHPAPAFDGPTPPQTFRIASGYWESVDEPFYPEPNWAFAHLNPDDTYEEGTLSIEAQLLEAISLDEVPDRGSRNWNGYASGLLEARTSIDDIHSFEGAYSLSNTDPTDVRFVTEGINGLGVQFNLRPSFVREDHPDSREGLTSNFDVATMEVNFGRGQEQEQKLDSDVAGVSGLRGVYVDDTAFAAISSRVFGDVDYSGQRLVYVNGQLVPNNRWPANTRVWMVSNDAAPAAGLLPDGVRYCDCDAARFGWWGGQIGIIHGPEGSRADALFPGTFIVGDLPGIHEIPSEGTASYTGHAAAAIRNAGAAYAAVGHFTMDWSFATRTGEVEINRLDNRSYEAPVSAAAANPRDFSGVLANTGGAAASGNLNGSFFAEAGNPVVDAGGRFEVQTLDGAYSAVGAFAATSQ
ncbi:MAG: FecR domain-containing protein [Rhodospirillaceae bacterium]|nr:FecR domain-containing protein [Rhodospirillaceae bacterium]